MTTSPAEQLRKLREQNARDLEDLESKIADAEYAYLTCDSSQLGNVLKGFDGFLSAKDSVRRKPRQPKLEERIFSLSSKKSTVSKEYEQQLQQDQADQINTHGGVPKKVFPHSKLPQKRHAQKLTMDSHYAKKARKTMTPV
ncbi:unnamed protein product [Ostreobium quekettii]|uniref:Chromatin modification-related protein EAF6 n=1 Tax=Ostreobium quekettii TaxID=121088 RepID=A0A8S1J022_9CHLO|nr:unnamed protein product [Ostreobium quekettii]|eukprot:evm.model.scf_1040.5 EVM.evm.TU.scf_1040.5   scf_1040:46687-50208(-)